MCQCGGERLTDGGGDWVPACCISKTALNGDQEWDKIIADQRPRPALSEVLDRYKSDLTADPAGFPKVAKRNFDPWD